MSVPRIWQMHQGGSLMSLLPGLASSQAHASEGLIRRRRTRSAPVSQAVRMIWAAMDGSTSEDGVQEAEAERRSSSTMNPHRSQPSSLWSVRALISLTILVNSRLSSSMVSM